MHVIYELSQPVGMEGRSHQVVGLFQSEATAKAVGKSGYGDTFRGSGPGRVREILIFGSAQDFYQHTPEADPDKYPQPEELDRSALALARARQKLANAGITPEELDILQKSWA